MVALVGVLLLAGPALYAAAWLWLRAGLASGKSSAFAASSLSTPGAENEEESASIAGLATGASSSFASKKEAQVVFRGLAEEVAANDELLFSVLIAARNEAVALPHLLAALRQQTLAPTHFEVLLADDHSGDATAELVRAAALQVPFRLRLISLPAGATGKKAALAAAEAQARAPWVVCTDADCRPAPGWLEAYASQLRAQPGLHFISGPVRLTPGSAWFDELLGLEFAGLVGVGAGCIARGRPTMCNGANLAYRRTTFHEVGGYLDNAGLASGDDEFLLHKMHERYPAGVRFLAQAGAVVDTPAPATLRALLAQRVRWASKWPHYRPAAPRQLALLVLGANVSLALGLGLAIAWPSLWPAVVAAWALKLGADAWLLWPMLSLLKRRRWLAWLLPLQVLYAPYALAVGLAGQRSQGYRWKDRQVR